MIRQYLKSLAIGGVALLGAAAATPSLAEGGNCVMSIDYSMLSDGVLDRLYKDIQYANDDAELRRSMKCAQSLTYSKLPDKIIDELNKGKSPVIHMAPTMNLYSPDYASLTEEQIRSYGGW